MLSSRMRPLAVILLAACAAIGMTTASASGAAMPRRASPAISMGTLLRMSPQAIARRQQPLLNVANQILRLTQRGAAAGYGGYADVTISVPSDLVVLYWHGTAPAALQRRLPTMRATAAIQVAAAPYTWQQLERQAHQIAAHQSILSARGYMLASAGPDPAAVGVRLGIDYARSRALTVLTPAARMSSVEAAVRQVVAGPAPVMVSNVPRSEAAGTRNVDTQPFWGGDRIVRPGNVMCSSGFSVFRGSTLYMVTAGHCGGINTPWQTGDFFGSGNAVGTEVDQAGCCDSAIIQVPSNQPYIYDLGWNSTAGELVIGTAAAVAGTLVCDEGATSGVRCGISINLTGQIASFSDRDSGPFTAENESEGAAIDPNPDPHYVQAVALGDSGGPVIINSGTLGQVYGAGTISGQDPNATVACSGTDPNVSTSCSGIVWFEEMIPIENLWGVTLATAFTP